MRKIPFFILIVMTWLLCQCSNHGEATGGNDYPSRKAFAAIDSCMSFMSSDPRKAHDMLDALLDARLMTKQRCDYYHAMVIYSGENNLDSALAICERLLDEGVFGDDSYIEEEICVLASNITQANMRHLETLKYANRGIAICHGNELMHDDEATLMTRVGAAEQALGRMEQASETYDKAQKLVDGNKSFAELITSISLRKKQAGLHSEKREFDSVILICHEILDLVNRFDRDPSFVDKRPETMQESGEATHDFADFYRCQMYGQIAHAYHRKIELGLSENAEAETDSVKAYMKAWSETDEPHRIANMASVMSEMYFAGMKDEFEKAKEHVAEIYRGDSLVNDYVEYLSLLAEDAVSNHDYAGSNAYLKRALAVSDSIRQNELMRMLTEQMSLNMVQQEQLARQDAEYQVSVQTIVIGLLSTILALIIIAGLVFAVLVSKYRKNKHMMEITKQDLTESKEEIKELSQQLDEARNERVAENHKALYERIERAMTEQRLYLNPDLDIIKVAEAAYSSRSVVSACINSITGKTFRQWLSEYRLSLFEEMLRNSPEESIDNLMIRCGYKDQSTFRRQFKAAYGMTAGEYRKMILSDED